MLRFAIKNVAAQVAFNGTGGSALLIRSHSVSPEKPAVEEQSDTYQDSADPSRLTAPGPKKPVSERVAEFRRKLKEDLAAEELNRYNFMNPIKDDPLPPWPNNVNPHTGEVGGPKGPEPTRYGDWERKGIAVDF